MVYKLNHGLIQDPTGLGPKTIPETRRSRAFGDPMIYLNVTNIMRRCDPERKELYDSRAQECVEEILKYHYKPELKCVLIGLRRAAHAVDEVEQSAVLLMWAKIFSPRG